MRTIRTFTVLTAVLLVSGVLSAQGQDKSRAQTHDKSSVARGELVKVDTAARTIVIRTESGPQMQFSYTAETKVVGAEKGVAGLATMTGTPVTVEFTRHEQTNLAKEIEVHQKKQQK
jgi:hypothetical protein